MASAAPAVSLCSAVSLLGRHPALAGVDLDVRVGEVVAIRGPNGAGKTTLLRACAGLVRVVRGRAEVLGHDLVRDPRAVRSQVGLLGHATFLYDDLSAIDNLRFSTRAGGGDQAAMAPALDRFGLSGRLATVPVSRLSVGQRRRVALAALVARSAALWLLDEPHAGLDADGRDLLDEAVRDAATAGKTVLLASHEPERAGSLAHRVVAMVGGRVLTGAEGPTHPAAGPDPGEGAGGSDPAEPSTVGSGPAGPSTVEVGRPPVSPARGEAVGVA